MPASPAIRRRSVPLPATVIKKLLELSREARSGVLDVDGEGVCTVIYILRGVPMFAEEGTLGETLGRILMREKVLTEAQYAQIIDRMTSSVMGAEQMRFGEVAIALGFLTPEQVNEALAKQVRRKIIRCIELENPTCVFRDAADQLEGIARYPCAVEPLVLRAVRHMFTEERITRILEGSADRYPELSAPADEVSVRFKMDPAETAFLKTLDRTQNVFQLIFSAPIDGLHASQLLAVLLVADAIHLHDEPPPDSLQDGAPVAVLVGGPDDPDAALPPGFDLSGASSRVDRPSSADPEPASHSTPTPPTERRAHVPGDAVRAAARHRLARRLARPKTPARAGRPRVATQSTPAPKSIPPPTKQARLRAEQLFKNGQVHVRNERWPLALQDLQHAVRLYPGAMEYQLYADWARFQTLTDPHEMAMLRNELEEQATQALRQDKQMAFAHHVLGQVKLMQGEEKAALRSFRTAMKLDSNDRVAARYYRMLSRKLS